MSKQRIALFVVLALLPIVLALWLAGFDVSYQLGNYVVSENAVVSGDLVQASSPTAGQIQDVLIEVGDPVDRGQELVRVVTFSGTAPPLRSSAPVRAPGAGTIVQMNMLRGQSVAAGQPIATIADLSRLWVTAQVDETAYKDVRSGMRALVKINALDRQFAARVVALSPDVATPVARAGATAGGARPTVTLPVRLAFDYGDAPIYPGMSASIRIFIREGS
ncbi:MAG: HlyD family efflux transporter periplasmic adaptor subunit [Chloroflexi bacterium]|nr:HlyD family efflux transporter periplasmic adaptor subunit [Chloroflexota bacterium]